MEAKLKTTAIKNDLAELHHCILMADDDVDDQYMVKEALISAKFDREIRAVNDGEELMDYLHRKGKFEGESTPLPSVILLDLNMPKKDGRECLKEIKADAKLNKIPVVVFSTSKNPDDVAFSYEWGASGYIAKPYSFKELVEVMDTFKKYWFSTVIPPHTGL